MTFEEFFKKKKIHLTALEHAEPGLFSEFKEHYAQMGEKSFDHTKKYWFNKLRLKYPAPVEAKAEKVHIENRLAEQTITEDLIKNGNQPQPKVGFTPRFKVAVTKLSESPATTQQEHKPAEPSKAETPTPDTGEVAAKVGFKPRFKAALTKQAEEQTEVPPAEHKPDAQPIEEISSENTNPAPSKVGFKPRFKAGVTKPAETSEEPSTETDKPVEKEAAEAPLEKAADEPAKIGFKPRFKAGVTKSAKLQSEDTASSDSVQKISESETYAAGAENEEKTDPDVESATAKPAYKPRFNMKNIKPKADDES